MESQQEGMEATLRRSFGSGLEQRLTADELKKMSIFRQRPQSSISEEIGGVISISLSYHPAFFCINSILQNALAAYKIRV